MDLLRLALERGTTAKESLEIIIRLLETYGQGGNCGYDHTFLYDNGFLILDRKELYVLQTAGKHWVYKKTDCASISNRLSIGTDGDAYSTSPCNFSNRYLEPVYSFFSGSRQRLEQTSGRIRSAQNVYALMAALRIHRNETAPLTRADVASTCMHAGGLIGDHTTASMIVSLDKDITVWTTGSSTPCISLFKPWFFGNTPKAPVFSANAVEQGNIYWQQRADFSRRAMTHTLPPDFYQERNALEEKWITQAQGFRKDSNRSVRMSELSSQAAAEESAFYSKWELWEPGTARGKRRFIKYWHR